jgi:hypothetical protein
MSSHSAHASDKCLTPGALHPIAVGLAVLATLMVLGCGGCKAPTGEPHRADPSVPAEATPAARTTTGEATLLLMADIRGVLRPCGCTVDLQKGGFDRLKPFLDDARAEHEGARLLHAGPLFFEASVTPIEKQAQRVRQSAVTAELLARVGVDVAGLTAVDSRASDGRLDALAQTSKVSLTAANFEGGGATPTRLIEAGGLEVGVFALASPAEADPKHLVVSDPLGAATRAVAELRGKADLVVLLSALGLRETKRLVRAVDGIDFAVVGGLGDHPVTSDEAELVGSTRVMQFHREGRFVGRLTIRMVDGVREFIDASAPSAAEIRALEGRIDKLAASLESWAKTRGDKDREVRNARHHVASLRSERDRLASVSGTAPPDKSSFSFRATPLNWDLPQDPDLLALMEAFDRELKEINLAHAKPLPEAKPGEAVYVGVAACMECHEETETFWKNDRHAHAWETLEEQNKTFDAECVSCHVTGYGRAGGSTLGKTEEREDVQCEACHGPGSLHAESDGDTDMPTLEPDEATCAVCHNSHHSPKFDFEKWKKRLLVPGHGLPLASD